MNRYLFVQPKLLKYREKFYTSLAESLNGELFICHPNANVFNKKHANLTELRVRTLRFWRFYFYFIRVGRSEYTKIVLPLDIYCINLWLSILFTKDRSRFILWGIGKGSNRYLTKLRLWIASKAKTIFYNSDIFDTHLLADNQVYCGNSVYVSPPDFTPTKKNMLFVGTLDDRKELDKVLIAFEMSLPYLNEDQFFIIIGDGPAKTKLEKIASKLNLLDRVRFLGRITDVDDLSQQYKEAKVSISYGQCGLSAIQSVGNGVPIITKHGAITGGETNIIVNNITGLVITDNMGALTGAIVQFMDHKLDSQFYYNNCIKLYEERFSLRNMVSVFKDNLE
ncbi:glycosyltransferase [Pseudoalteromonas sp. S983]|uniref:glycosyltransferase n=1 Tax=Pseudoalteromonas sp. S983 TaxID=579572 RepID=UPI00110B3BD0|nr:glycosyltransferase [Pseudoalteromonas sp. S983]TMP79135.1 hypothetical protein CWB71_16420 [Pseudoalteromonas sp. S983]